MLLRECAEYGCSLRVGQQMKFALITLIFVGRSTQQTCESINRIKKYYEDPLVPKDKESDTFKKCNFCCCDGQSGQKDCSNQLEDWSQIIPESDLRSFHHLYMDRSGLDEVPSFPGDNRLVEWWARFNKISFLDVSKLKALTMLRLINLQGNMINSTTGLGTLNSVEILELPVNQFTSLSKQTFASFPELRNLSLSSNQVSEISKDAFERTPKIQQLILRRNYLNSEILSGALNLPELVKLDLSGNLITFIERPLFAALEKLQYLDLSDNHMNHIAMLGFTGLKNLIHLDLSDNWFVTMIPDSFEQLAANTTIDISVNPLICDCAQQAFVSWLKIHARRVTRIETLQCMAGGDEKARLRAFKLVLDMTKINLCDAMGQIGAAIVAPAVVFGVIVFIALIACIKRKIFSETKEIEEFEQNQRNREMADDLGSLADEAAMPASVMPQLNPDLMANRPEVMGAVRENQLLAMGMDPLHARIQATRGTRDMSNAAGYSSSAYGSEDEKPRRVNRPDLNARRRPSDDSDEEDLRERARPRGAGF